MKSVKKQTGKVPVELIGPKFPKLLDYPWSVFLQLSSTRQTDMNGYMPISYTEIESWKRLTDNELSEIDLKIIRKLDQVFLEVVNG